MAVSGIGAAAGPAAASTSQVLDRGTNQLGKDQFLTLLIAQLQHQDPLNPVNESDFTAQLAQLSQVDSMQQLTANIKELLLVQGLGQGANLIGKSVQFTPAGSNTVQTGIVGAVTVANGQVQLQVGANTVPLNQVKGIVGSGS